MELHCWVGVNAPCTFGAFIPFLQVAFGINMLFGAWDGIYDRLTKFEEKSSESDENLLSSVDAADDKKTRLYEKRKSSQATRKFFRRAGQAIGLTLASIIAITLLVIGKDTVLTSSWGIVIALTGGTVPILMTVMVFVDRRFQRQIRDEVHKIARDAADAATAGRKGAIQVAGSLRRD